MPKVTIDIKNIDIVVKSLTVLQDLLNDEQLPEELRVKYGKKLEEIE